MTAIPSQNQNHSLPSLDETFRTAGAGRASYLEILKSSALMGGASLVNIGVGIMRTKAMAVILGPAGVGLFGLYGSIADIVQTVAGLGVSSSGVRQIAHAMGSSEEPRVARTATVLRWVAPILGIIGSLILITFARQISVLTFGTDRNTTMVTCLSMAVLLSSAAGGQSALLQGMRLVKDLARVSVFAGLGGTVISIPLIYFFREHGVVPALIGTAAMALATTSFYSRKVALSRCRLQWSHIKEETAGLLALGVAFMASGLMTMGAFYFIRIMIVHSAGIEAAGLYQSAWGIGGLYVGILLQAMGADFFPRLTAAAQNHEECNRLVNEQARISLLLAGPGILATMTFAPVVVALFYSAKFGAAVGILRWICLGMILRVVSWPMGYILLARGERRLFFWTEAAAAIVHCGLGWACLRWMGLSGAGAAFFGLYLGHLMLIYAIVRRLTNFRWSPENRRIALLFLPIIALTFALFLWFPFWIAEALGTAALIFTATYSAQSLLRVIAGAKAPVPVASPI